LAAGARRLTLVALDPPDLAGDAAGSDLWPAGPLSFCEGRAVGSSHVDLESLIGKRKRIPGAWMWEEREELALVRRDAGRWFSFS
ncbi:hypothetical protein, partial [Salmonella enterica]|uniref:hypothetical protein n=1 Tax=Salmonella enterica TaxID=28901 RepID=UPI0020C24FCB